MARIALIGFALWFAAFAIGVGAFSSDAMAAETNRAVVIVDTGTEVHEVVISFAEDSISGIDALVLAGADPKTVVMRREIVVCALYGVGHPAERDCFDGRDDIDDDWAYYRAPSSESTFDEPSIDPGSTLVHDGDVEGWKWGNGSAPAYVSLADLTAPLPEAGEPPPTETPPTTGPPAPRPPMTRPNVTAPPAKAPAAPTASGTVSGTKPAAARVAARRSSVLPSTGGVAKPSTKTPVPARSAETPTRRAESAFDFGEPEPEAVDSQASEQMAGMALTSFQRDSSTTWSYVGLGLVVVSIIGASLLFRTRKRPA